ncbi:MAG: TonB-dependent receptor [Staphylococcus sp.]|nr:TonB-dependent receptor [Staphylococcus sp.]
MLKQFIIMMGIAAIPAMAVGQTAAIDSIASDSIETNVELGEVLVKAPRVVRKADMDVFYPSRSSIENSQNGMALLNRLMIPTLSVNEILGTVTTSGQAVQIRINGRKADVQQLKNLEPSSVKRIEWMDNPGLRYGDVPAVINIIMANPTVGGSLMTSASPSLTQAFGQYNLDLKLNSGRSQWSIGGYYKMTNHLTGYRQYEERFTSADGEVLNRTEYPVKGVISNNQMTGWLNYSYINPGKTVVWAGLRDYCEPHNVLDYHGLMKLSDGSPDLRLRDKTYTDGSTPSLNLYVEQQLPRKQTVVVDMSTSLYNGRSQHLYIESPASEPEENIVDVGTSIKDHNYTISAEADYIKNWKSSRFTAGVAYTANRNRSTYINLDDAVFHQHQDRTYFFGEYFHRIGRVSLTGGLGAQYVDIKSVESGRGTNSWALRPRFSAAWRIADGQQLRFNFTSWQTNPSLSETNVAMQQIDGFQWQVGNPDLKTYSNYRLTLNYNFDYSILSGTLGGRWQRSPDAIASFMEWDGDRLVTSYENSHGRTDWQVYFSPQISIIPGWLMANGTINYSHTVTTGTGYRHRHANWSGNVTVMATHWGWTAYLLIQQGGSTLSGETITSNERFSACAIDYRWKSFEFEVGMMMPFLHYSQGSKSLNRYNSNHYTMRTKTIEHMPFVKVAYNLKWGHQKRGASKLINADSSVEQSKAAGR